MVVRSQPTAASVTSPQAPAAPSAVRGRYLPALDGIRALAIAGVFAYHLGYGWAAGGFLGVDLFFVLSGFLITSLLVEEWAVSGAIRLGAFWGRRALRLLPALVVMLLALGAFLGLAGPGPLVDLHVVRTDAVATVLYVANWHQLFAHQSYFDRFAAPSPLQHTWSLAIEEQFYLVWPLVVLGLLAVARRLGVTWRWLGVALSAAGAAASAAWMAWLAAHGASINRLYYGTDTRAFDLLCGATLAFLVAARPQPGRRARRALAVVALSGTALLAVLWWRGGGSGGTPWHWMFEWGFLVAAVAAAAVIADARQVSTSPLGRVLALAPLRFVGRISYELYLWHWPVICELTGARLGLSGPPLALAQVGIATALAAVTHFLVANPLRRWRSSGVPIAIRIAAAPVGLVGAAAVMVVATVPAAVAAPTEKVPVVRKLGVAEAPKTIFGGPIKLGWRPTAADPLHIELFGDSVMSGEAPAVEAAFGSTGAVQVVDTSFDGWGLTTDTNWRAGIPQQIATAHAQLVVVMWSWDDNFLVAHKALYASWLREFTRIVLAQPGVAGLVYEEFPQLGPLPEIDPGASKPASRKRNLAVDAWNGLARTMVAVDPSRVVYLPIAPSVETPSHHFSFWLPPGDHWSLPPADWQRVRSVDTVHFCPPGAARYADALLRDLSKMFQLPKASADWSVGPWTNDPALYEGPLEGCPDDHPA